MSLSAARKAFPSGLEQPEGSMRFSVDPLLLAAFAAGEFPFTVPCGLKNSCRRDAIGIPGEGFAALEIGCGAGACLLALHLLTENIRSLGIDCDSRLTASAQNNARSLGLDKRMSFLTADINEYAITQKHPWCDLIVTNPPYWEEKNGYHSREHLNNMARRGKDALRIFVQAASSLLVHHGFLFLIYPAARIAHATQTLGKAHLGIRTLRFVRSKADEPANRVLITARKNANDDTKVLPDLVLYKGTDNLGNALPTRSAYSFCPWIFRRPPVEN